MISFERKDSKVLVNIEHGLWYGNEYFPLEINQNYAYQAELLKNQFQKHLNDSLEHIKEKYYNKGWKEAKARTKKQTDFWGGWEK